MAKDPAMLWYWSDWHSGTTTLSRFLKGCYMDLLHSQFNSGRLTLEEIKTVLGSDFGQSWPTLQKKFTVDATGKYFNVKLETEKIKRANFTASRRKNAENQHKHEHMPKHILEDMEDVNANDNLNENLKKGAGEKLLEDRILKHDNHRTRLMIDKPNREAIEVQCRGNVVDNTLLIRYNAHLLTSDRTHEKYSEYLKNLRNWINTKPPEKNGSPDKNKPSKNKQAINNWKNFAERHIGSGEDGS